MSGLEKLKPQLVCGVLLKTSDGLQADVLEKARSLTISWLRWSYFGQIIEGNSVDEILDKSADQSYNWCFIQGAGHILPDQWSALQDEKLEFFSTVLDETEKHKFFVSADIKLSQDGAVGLQSRWLIVNLSLYRELGRPRFNSKPEGAEFLKASSALGLPLYGLSPLARNLMLDLGSDLADETGFLVGLADRSERCSRGVFPWNFESYDDIAVPPDDWAGPVSVLYSVAAGLKPDMILRTHGFNDETRVVLLDYSLNALAFRELMQKEWDGRNYPQFLKAAAKELPGDTYYYLWPDGSLDDPESVEMQIVWNREIERWGGEENLRQHWLRAKELRYSYLPCNLITEPEPLFEQLADERGAVFWWSNSFQTAFSSNSFTVDEKRDIYEKWIWEVAARAPRLLLYGSDHSNSSVNGFEAADYLEAYKMAGGDPLVERRLHRRELRF